MKKRKYRIFALYLLISFAGLLNIYSVSKSLGINLFYKHLTAFLLALIIFLIFHRVKIPEWKELSYLFYIIGILMLLLVLIKEQGVKRWFHVFNFSFQVSDAVKPLLIYFFSILWAGSKRGGYIKSFYFFILHLLPFILILIEPDLGSATFYIFLYGIFLLYSDFEIKVKLLFFFAFLSLLFSFNFLIFLIFSVLSLLFVIFGKKFVMNDKLFLTFSIMMPGLVVPFIFNNVLKEYQRKRIIYFLNPSKDPKGGGWQLLQGKLAIGSGGITGKGFLKGTHKSLAFLPAAHSDFAFASFAEEFGFIGSLFLLLFYFLLLREILSLSFGLRGFYSFFVLGIFSSIFYSFFLNIGGVIGLIPLTGIPLPFFSYGGTNFLIHTFLLSLCTAIGD